MGYDIRTNCAQFTIKKKNFLKLLDLVDKNSDKFDMIYGCFAPGSDDKSVATAVARVFDEVGIEVDIYDSGDIDTASCRDKLIYQEEFLRVIAPIVEPDSYIEISGEDGELWRWVFKFGKFHEIRPEWPEVTEEQP